MSPRVEVKGVDQLRDPRFRGQAGDAPAEGHRPLCQDLLGVRIQHDHGPEHAEGKVGLVQRERVVGDQLGKRVGDRLQHPVRRVLRHKQVGDV